MRCPFRKIISTTKELNENSLVDEITTEIFAECLKLDCMAYRIGQQFNCGLIEYRLRNI